MRKLTAYSIIAISAATLFFSCGKEKISNQQAICKVYVDAPEDVTATTAGPATR